MYAISQNKDNPDATKKALLNCVPHMYNEHGNCGEWCKHKLDPTKNYKSLPYGNWIIRNYIPVGQACNFLKSSLPSSLPTQLQGVGPLKYDQFELKFGDCKIPI